MYTIFAFLYRYHTKKGPKIYVSFTNTSACPKRWNKNYPMHFCWKVNYYVWYCCSLCMRVFRIEMKFTLVMMWQKGLDGMSSTGLSNIRNIPNYTISENLKMKTWRPRSKFHLQSELAILHISGYEFHQNVMFLSETLSYVVRMHMTYYRSNPVNTYCKIKNFWCIHIGNVCKTQVDWGFLFFRQLNFILPIPTYTWFVFQHCYVHVLMLQPHPSNNVAACWRQHDKQDEAGGVWTGTCYC